MLALPSLSVSSPANESILVATCQPSVRRCPVSTTIDNHRSILELIDSAARLCVSMKNTVMSGLEKVSGHKFRFIELRLLAHLLRLKTAKRSKSGRADLKKFFCPLGLLLMSWTAFHPELL